MLSIASLAAIVLLLAAILSRRRDRVAIVWAGTPILNVKYWSLAIQEAGWVSSTVVSTVYTTINKRDDYDHVYDDLVPRIVPGRALRGLIAPYAAFRHVLRNAALVHLSFDGGPLGGTPLWRWEAPLLRHAGVRTVAIPYGGDIFVLSRLTDPSVKDGLLRSYPQAGRRDREIARRVDYWSRYADLIIVGFALDGLPRWDVVAGNMVVIDTEQWTSRCAWSRADGTGRDPVRVLHTPNHRGAKGTAFIEAAVESLRTEGLNVDLVLAEGMQNEQMRELMLAADILADQLILPGYGLAAIEGMAAGLPVVCNLEHPGHTELLDRRSFLSECPVVSASPETFRAALRALVANPALREQLGRAGRAYTVKYHSYAAAQYLFGSVYERLLRGADVDLSAPFDPLSSPFNRRAPTIEHPLVDHRLSATES